MIYKWCTYPYGGGIKLRRDDVAIYQIISEYNHKNHSVHSIELLCTMIDFYNKCNDMNSALAVFNSVSDKKKIFL